MLYYLTPGLLELWTDWEIYGSFMNENFSDPRLVDYLGI